MKLVLIIALLLLSACGDNNMVRNTAPGTAIPDDFLAACHAWDDAGRCKDWHSDGGQCVNPLGIDHDPILVSCASIKKKAAPR